MSETGERFERAVAIMARLRAPGGCPWDREQTFDTIKQYTLEETYEVLEAIENRDWYELTGELGDLLLQVLFYAEMAKEDGHFSVDDVLDRLSTKLVTRHPHVFGDVKAETSAQVLRNWEAIKQQERKQREPARQEKDEKPKSILDGVSSAMPALLEGLKLSNKAAHVGFDWPNIEGLFDKLKEETRRAAPRSKPDTVAGADAHRPRHCRLPRAGAARGTECAAGGRDRRPAVCAGQHRALLECRSRVFTARNQPQVSPAFSACRGGFAQAVGKKPEEASLDEMEAHWQASKSDEK